MFETTLQCKRGFEMTPMMIKTSSEVYAIVQTTFSKRLLFEQSIQGNAVPDEDRPHGEAAIS
jgi:hypothetical protein